MGHCSGSPPNEERGEELHLPSDLDRGSGGEGLLGAAVLLNWARLGAGLMEMGVAVGVVDGDGRGCGRG